MALFALVLSAASNAASAKRSEFPGRRQVRWPTQYIVGFSLSECTPNIRLTTLRQSPRQRRTTAMAPKVENKQGRSIFRAIIIFCPRFQDFVDCSIMRLRAFCGDETTILGDFTHKARKNHMLGKRMHWVLCAYYVAPDLSSASVFWFEQSKIFYFWGCHLILHEGG